MAIAGDTDIESDETFTLGLSNPTGGAVIGAAGVGTITNDDQAALTISIGDIAIVEGNAGTANALVPVTLSAAATTAVSARYVTARRHCHRRQRFHGRHRHGHVRRRTDGGDDRGDRCRRYARRAR